MGQSLSSSASVYSYLNHLKWLTTPSVTTEDCHLKLEELGEIKGKTFTIDAGQRVDAYLGVPFAKCGAYEERFQKPKPVEPWTDIKDCREFGPRSLQVDMLWDYFLTPVRQDEVECLNMNIFVPQLSDEKKSSEGMPVMVFVHGGGYVIQSAANYGDRHICRNLCKHGVIVCVIQYRLGLLGFMSSGDAECPGNFGLYDQREAFLWIKKHIHNFGGNPNNVTAFGQSAGAASIDLLSISPYCRGLFNRCILMGGNAASDWSIGHPEQIIKAAAEVAQKAGWTGDPTNTKELLAFLRRVPSDQCKAPIFGKSAFNRSNKGLDFCPVIDGDFLPESVAELRKKAPKLEVVIGTTDFEALLFVAIGRRSQSDLLSFEKQLQINIPTEMKKCEELREQARDLYLRDVNKTDKLKVAKSFMRLYSDSLMNNSTQRYVHEMTQAGHQVYLYNFTHCNLNSCEFFLGHSKHYMHAFGTKLFNIKSYVNKKPHSTLVGLFAYRVPFVAATHCYELRYLFGKGMFAKFRPDETDLKVLDLMSTMWTNYAKTGDPNYDQTTKIWLPTPQTNTYLHLQIDKELQFVDNYQERRAQFWLQIDKHRKQDENSNEIVVDLT